MRAEELRDLNGVIGQLNEIGYAEAILVCLDNHLMSQRICRGLRRCIFDDLYLLYHLFGLAKLINTVGIDANLTCVRVRQKSLRCLGLCLKVVFLVDSYSATFAFIAELAVSNRILFLGRSEYEFCGEAGT